MNHAQRRCSECAIAILLSANSLCFAATFPPYTITNLGVGPGDGLIDYSINRSGQIAGTTFVAGTGNQAYVYDGSIHYLGTLGGATSQAADINSSGQIVGNSRTADNIPHAFLYDHGTMTNLGALLNDVTSEATGINDLGQVVGFFRAANDTANHAFLYDGTMHDLGSFGGPSAIPSAINNSGVIVGSFRTPAGQTLPFYYDGTMHNVGNLSDNLITAADINDAGQIVGLGSRGTFLYQNGMVNYIADGALNPSAANGINSSGQVVGHARNFVTLAQVGFLYDPVLGLNLSPLVSLTWRITDAKDINDAGQIVAVGQMNNASYIVLLTPVPEPSSLVLAALGFMLLAACVWRRNR